MLRKVDFYDKQLSSETRGHNNGAATKSRLHSIYDGISSKNAVEIFKCQNMQGSYAEHRISLCLSKFE